MDQYGTQYMTVGDPEAGTKKGGGGWIWGILIFILVVVAIIFLILWLVERNKSASELTISGTQFSLTSSNAVQATWTSVGNDNDQVTLYVYQSGTPIKFNTSGTPTNPSAVKAQAGPVNGNTTKTITTTALKTGVTYNGVLVVTNSNITAHNAVISDCLHAGGDIAGAFHIEASCQSGEIVYDIPAVTAGIIDVPTVGYNFTDKTSIDNNLFHHDSDNLLCTVMPSQTAAINADPTTKCGALGSSTHILYDPSISTTTTTGLGIKQYEASDITNTSAQWTYNKSNNKWCLANNSAKCMELSDFITLATESTNINVGSPGGGWNNINFSLSST